MRRHDVVAGLVALAVLTGGVVSLAAAPPTSPTLNAPAPKDAIVLFDGTNLDAWATQKSLEWETPGGPGKWKITPESALEVVPGAGSIITKKRFGDFKLHVEFRLLGGSVNSGVYLLSRYEVNIKDSYGQTEGAPCAALGNCAPAGAPPLAVNAALPDLRWQSLDMDFRAPRFDAGGERTAKARLTVVYNGVKIYDNVELEAPKGAAKRMGEAPNGPIMLQEHGSALQFRNIWIVGKPSEK